MADYTLTATLDRPYAEAVDDVRRELAEVGFGILSEIDLAGTLKKKLGVDVAPQVILGACRPQLAHQALAADPSIAALLPCNVVVRAVDERTTIVEAFDPQAMIAFAGDTGHGLRAVADDARQRLTAALAALTGEGH